MKPVDKFFRYLGLSEEDKKRLFQCASCKNDSTTCGCDESNEDDNGMCEKWERRAE